MTNSVKASIGSKITDFDLEAFSQEGGISRVSSESLHGSIYVLAFYPKDDTPGCTKEMCAFRDDFIIFKEKGIAVFGVSKDSLKSHEKFSNKYELGSLTLLSDTTGELSDSLSVGSDLPKRTLFVIGSDSTIKHIQEGMPKNTELLGLIEKLR